MKRFIALLITALLFVSTPIYSATNFPSSLDVFTDQTSSDLITSAKWNNMQDAIEAAQAKIGADSSSVTTSLDYLVRNASSSNPGHKHTLANGATDITLTATQINSLINSVPPVGSIIAYSPGYFTDDSNNGFTYRMVNANTIDAVNALLNPAGWYVCNGAALNDSASDIFNGENRYLPNLTDDRFIMGDTLGGVTGGANSIDLSHYHTTPSHALTISEMPSHTHGLTNVPSKYHAWNIALGTDPTHFGFDNEQSVTATNSAGSGAAHSHGNTGTSLSATQENRPKYLSCFYIMRVH